jgi:hypothetical protein
MDFILDFLSEVIPRFRTERCAFTIEDLGDGEASLLCIGRLVDLDDDEDFDATMDVSALGWLYMRAFLSFKTNTFTDFRKEGTDNE